MRPDRPRVVPLPRRVAGGVEAARARLAAAVAEYEASIARLADYEQLLETARARHADLAHALAIADQELLEALDAARNKKDRGDDRGR